MKTFTELYEWAVGAEEEFGDSSAPVSLMFFRWVDDLENYGGDELACGLSSRPDHIDLLLGPRARIAIPIETGKPAFSSDPLEGASVERFGVEMVAPGFWALTPSLNLPEFIHGFVVLYNVPQPAPWEQRVILATDACQLTTALKVMR